MGEVAEGKGNALGRLKGSRICNAQIMNQSGMQEREHGNRTLENEEDMAGGEEANCKRVKSWKTRERETEGRIMK